VYWAVAGSVVIGGYVATDLLIDAGYRFTMLGLIAALVIGGAGWYAERRYRAEARRLADAAGIDR
jgi:hypothetical protein